MEIRWKLRMAAAQREVWTGAQLRRLLAERAGLELSSASVSALLTKQPAQVKLSTLVALCTALECTPNDLFEVDTTPAERPAAPPAAAAPAAASAGPFDAADLTGRPVMKRQRDCARCGAAVGIIGRDYCCRCWHRRQAEAARSSCPGCGLARVLLAGTGRCERCSRVCADCGGPVRRRDRDRCTRCHHRREREQARQACPRCGKPGYLREQTGWCGSCSRPGPGKDPPRICAGCGEVRRHCGPGLCDRCWQKNPQRPFVAASSLAARLDDPPSWLGDFAGCAAAGFAPSRAAGLIGQLGRLLEDGGSQHPQALLDRSRQPGRSPGALARTLETFFVTRGLALPTDQAGQLAAGRRERRIDAVPGPLRPAVAAFTDACLTARERARRAGTRHAPTAPSSTACPSSGTWPSSWPPSAASATGPPWTSTTSKRSRPPGPLTAKAG